MSILDYGRIFLRWMGIYSLQVQWTGPINTSIHDITPLIRYHKPVKLTVNSLIIIKCLIFIKVTPNLAIILASYTWRDRYNEIVQIDIRYNNSGFLECLIVRTARRWKVTCCDVNMDKGHVAIEIGSGHRCSYSLFK